MLDKNIRLYAIGQIERLPENVRQALHKVMEINKKKMTA